jgi:hypothetical protein
VKKGGERFGSEINNLGSKSGSLGPNESGSRKLPSVPYEIKTLKLKY